MNNLTFEKTFIMIKKIALLFVISLCLWGNDWAKAQSVVQKNGSLQVIGRYLCNSYGEPIQLRGVSSHGLQWYNNCMTPESIQFLSNNWGIDVLRIPVYIKEGGYQKDSVTYLRRVEHLIDECTKTGIYCIVDWHVLIPGNPLAKDYKGALPFFSYLAKKYKDNKNILYEICNEPSPTIENGGPDWQKIKSYAVPIIEEIRKYSNSVVIIGTPQWSQLIDDVIGDALPYNNLMYSFHFYAGSHSFLKESFKNAALHVPVFITEWGITRADNINTPLYLSQADEWLAILQSMKISWCYWNFSDGKDSSSVLNQGACMSADWENVKTSGQYVKKACSSNDMFIQGNGKLRILYAEINKSNECCLWFNKDIELFAGDLKKSMKLKLGDSIINDYQYLVKPVNNKLIIHFVNTIQYSDNLSVIFIKPMKNAKMFEKSLFVEYPIINSLKNKQETRYLEEFSNVNSKLTYTSEQSTKVLFEQKNGKLQITCKNFDSNIPIAEFWFNPIDIKSYPVFKIAIMSNKNIGLRVDLMDVKGNQTNGKPRMNTILEDSIQHIQEYRFNNCFYQMPPESWQVNSQKINKVLFYVYPENKHDDIEISIDNFEIGR